MFDTEGVAKLFKDYVFPFMGLLKKIISDRDPQFMSSFFKKLCRQLDMVSYHHHLLLQWLPLPLPLARYPPQSFLFLIRS
jgi:hypothetical protein